MQKRYLRLAQHFNWWADTPHAISKLDSELRPWANDKGSLTSALVKLSNGDFRVNVLRQEITIPYFHEQRKLARPLHKAAMIREVELCLAGETVVFARSVIPLNLVSNGNNSLVNIGRTPLGHLLFKDGRIRVSKRELTQLQLDGENVIARRTPYDYQGSRILVAEFFLPNFRRFL